MPGSTRSTPMSWEKIAANQRKIIERQQQALTAHGCLQNMACRCLAFDLPSKPKLKVTE